MNGIHFSTISPLRDDVRTLMEQLNAHNLSHCPPEICHLATPEQLAGSDCTMIGAFSRERLCGMGAIRFMDSYGEITRMFVEEDFRRKGIAKQILDLLVQCAINRNLQSVKLETSVKFTNAVSFYAASGFTACAPFGDYVHAPHNSYMKKILRIT